MTNNEGVIEIWRERICKRPNEIDPSQRFTWEALWVGLCVGLSREDLIDSYMELGFPVEMDSAPDEEYDDEDADDSDDEDDFEN